MQPDFGQVIDVARSLYLGSRQSVFPDSLMLKAAKRAVDEMHSVFKAHQLPAVRLVSSAQTIAAAATEFDPATVSILGDIIYVEERASGSSDSYTEVTRVDNLPQRDASSLLNEFTNNGGKLQFVAPNADVQIRIHYFASGAAEDMEQSATIAVDDCLNFLAAATAAKAGPSKGYTTEAKNAKDEAYGENNRNPLAVLGGYLQLLVEPQVRLLQQSPVIPTMYRAGR